ncbi:hypothetical protein EON63_21540 [archaeon]|nr:MAG: hypothetical protein EON63_21540 [archaeon]
MRGVVCMFPPPPSLPAPPTLNYSMCMARCRGCTTAHAVYDITTIDMGGMSECDECTVCI